MATVQEATRRLTVEARSVGVKETARDARELGAAVDGVAVSSQRAEKATHSLDGRLASIQRKYDAQFRAQMEMARVERTLVAAQAQGLITIQRRLELQSLAAERHGLATAAINREIVAVNGLAAANRNLAAANSNRFNTANIAAQFQDIGVTAAMGMSPIQIALQQGTQLSAVFDQIRSSGQRLSTALAAAFTSLISPVSLLTIGVIALGTAAAQYFMGSTRNTRTLNDALADHEANISRIKDRWGEATKGIEAYRRESTEIDRLRRAATANELRMGARSGIEDVLGAVTGMADQDQRTGQVRYYLHQQYDVFAEAIERLRSSARNPSDLLEFRKAIADIWALNPNSADVLRYAQSLITMSDEASRAALALDATGDALGKLDNRFRDLASKSYRDSLKAISGAVPDTRTDRERLDADFRRAFDAAGSTGASAAAVDGARIALTREYKAALQEIVRIELIRREGHELDMRAVGARTAAEKASIAAERVRLELSGQAMSIQDKARRVQEAHDLSMAQSAHEASEALRARIEAEKDAVGSLQLQIGVLGKTAGETARLTTEYELLRAAKQAAYEAGTEVGDAEIERIRRHAAEVGKLTEELAAAKAMNDLLFERDQMFRSPIDRKVFAELRSIGLDINSIDGQRIADNIRINEGLTQQRDLLMGIAQAAADAFRKGPIESWMDAIERLIGLLGQVGQMLMGIAAQNNGGLFAGFGGGGGGSGGGSGLGSVVSSLGAAGSSLASGVGNTRISAVGVDSILTASTSALNTSSTAIRYANQNATRSLALSERLVNAMTPVLSRLGVTMEVYSGGQVSNAAGVGVGSTRHNGGNAADVNFYIGNRKLNWSNPADIPIYQAIVAGARQNGVTGFGAGPGYMSPGSMHIGYGTPAVWGAGGKGANAPGWLSDAFNNPGAFTMAVSDGVMGGMERFTGLPAAAPIPTSNPMTASAPAAGGQGGGLFGGGGGGKGGGWAIAGAALSGLAAGYESGDPLMGALSGALGGLASGNIWGALAGGIAGLVGAFIRMEVEAAKARQKLEDMRHEIDGFIATGLGQGIGSSTQAYRDFTTKSNEYRELAKKARDYDRVKEIEDAVNAFFLWLRQDFERGFEGLKEGLAAGRGLDEAFGAGQQQIVQIREMLKDFVGDAVNLMIEARNLGAAIVTDEDIAARRAETEAAAATFALSLLSGRRALTAVEEAMEETRGMASALQTTLEQLGYSSADAAIAIEQHLAKALRNLAESVEFDLAGSLFDLMGFGWMNDVLAAQAGFFTRMRDLAAVGKDTGGAVQEASLVLGQILSGLALTEDQTKQILSMFPGVSGIMSTDNTAQLLADAEAALEQAKSDLIAAYEAEIDVLETLVSGMERFMDAAKRFRDDMRFGSASPLSQQEQMEEALKRFRETAALALAGDEEAMDRLIDTGQVARDEARAYYASSESYAKIWEEIDQTIASVEDYAGRQLTEAQREIALLIEQRDAQLGTIEATLSVAEAVDRLALAQAAADEARALNDAAMNDRFAALMNLLNAQSAANAGSVTGGYSAEVTKLYQSILGREPDASGAAFWQAGIDRGMSMDTIYRQFIQSVIDAGVRPNADIARAYGFSGFATGGYTGDIGTSAIAGVVHGNEFVAHAEATRRWRPQLEAMNRGTYAAGADNRDVVAELRELRKEVAELRAEKRRADSQSTLLQIEGQKLQRQGNAEMAEVADQIKLVRARP